MPENAIPDICLPWLLIMYCQEYTFGVICRSALQYGINSDIVLYFQIVYWLLFIPYCLPFSTLAMALSHGMIRNFLFRGMKGWRGSQFVTILIGIGPFSRGHEKWRGEKKWPTPVEKQSLPKMHSLQLLLLLLYITFTTGGKSVILQEPFCGEKRELKSKIER